MKVNVVTLDVIGRTVIGLLLVFATLAEMIGAWGWIGLVILSTRSV